MTMARMHNPPHPGLTLRDDVLPALRQGVTQAAEQLGVSRVALSRCRVVALSRCRVVTHVEWPRCYFA